MSRLAPETHYLPAPPARGRRAARWRAPAGLRACVVGGGIAGLSAASVLAERGVQVTLLERDDHLGGRAASFGHALTTSDRVQMERGFHGFFRQYYNLRALLKRVDPSLRQLTPLADYPILGPEGLRQSFTGLPTRPPFQLIQLVWQTPFLHASDLVEVDKRRALAMLRYDARATYREYDQLSAREYLDSLRFPVRARRMLFDVFSHSFFNPEAEMSAAELLMMFHFYFTANPEGLVFDVANRPMSDAFWTPLGKRLDRHAAEVCTGVSASRVTRRPGGGFIVEHDAGSHDVDLLVLALDVGGLRRLVDASPDLKSSSLQRGIDSLARTRSFAVLRLWLDRPLARSRASFAGIAGVGHLDNISIYDRFQDESREWAEAHGGAVVELHAYAVPPEIQEADLRRDLIDGLHSLYDETREARILHECMLWRDDCPAFAPGSHALRPSPATAFADLCLAGDFVRMPFPCALMERAAASGMLAANHLLAPYGVAPEPMRSVPSRGLLSPLSWPSPHPAVEEASHASA